MTSPNVTVIIPAYNAAAFVQEALESVRRQTYQDFEVILVDDGSTDRTHEKAVEFAKTWDKLWVIRTEHGGLARARNRAFSEAKGQWIALLDADDLWQKDKLDKCMSFLNLNPSLSVVYHPMSPISPEGRPLRGRSKRCRGGWLTEQLFHRIFINDPTAVFHRRVIDTVGPFDQSLPVCVGHEFWLRVSTKFEIGLLDEPLALRRCHEASLTRRDRTRANRVKTEMLERFYFDRGGKDIIKHPRKALQRLAKVRYHAGRLFLSQGDYRIAADYFHKAFKYNPLEARIYPFLLWSWLRSLKKPK